MRPIPGYPEYRAGEDGEVYSAWKRVGPPDFWVVSDEWTRMVKKPPKRTCRYPSVGLRRGGKQDWMTVHSLVSLAWNGPVPEGMEISHKDGNPLNSTPSNLGFKTHVDNCHDKVAHGTNAPGYGRVTTNWILQQMKELRLEL